MLDGSEAQPDMCTDAAVVTFRSERERFFARHAARWPGALADPFDLLDLQELAAADVAAIEAAAAGVGAIYHRLLPVLRLLDAEALVEMGVRPEAIALSRTSVDGLDVPPIARVDLARTPDGYKLLEYNADAPGLIVEAFGLNGLVCADHRRRDTNARARRVLALTVRAALRAAARHVAVEAPAALCVFAFTRRSWRDRAAAVYLSELAAETTEFQAEVVPFESLRLSPDGLHLPDGRRVDVLWRSCPIRYLGAKLSSPESSAETSSALLGRVIRECRLAVVNAPDASLLESKATQATIWGLAHEARFFSDAEAKSVERFFLPTFLDPPESGEPYVVKPAFGSEGDSVTIVDAAHRSVRRSTCNTYAGDPAVYQRYVPIPVAPLMTESGVRALRLVASCFLLAGQPAGIILRASDDITDDAAWVVPVGGGPLT